MIASRASGELAQVAGGRCPPIGTTLAGPFPTCNAEA